MIDTSVCAALLKGTMGLDIAAIGPSAIEHAVQQRMAACLQPDVRAYERLLFDSALELQSLIEAAVVPETWFFRDGQAFVEMVSALEPTSCRADRAPLRLLSLPCSTGEEPYSMAMTMLDAGFTGNDFRIDAVDISSRALASAGRAVYGRNSFRGSELAFRERHFESTAAGYRLNDVVREVVHFTQGNMFASDFLPQFGLYDVVFCRNLLVYFDRAAQSLAIEKLGRILKDTGTIFVGPAEAGTMFNHAFVWSKAPLAFAFRKGHAGAATAPKGATPRQRRERRALVPARATPPTAPIRAAPVARAAEPPQVQRPRSIDLAEATAHADAGRFSHAAEICREYLRAHGASATAFYLMGLICNAAGDTADALRYFKKALYLDAEHAGSLAHLALLLEKRGDAGGARLLRERLRRQRVDIGAAT